MTPLWRLRTHCKLTLRLFLIRSHFKNRHSVGDQGGTEFYEAPIPPDAGKLGQKTFLK